MTRRDREVHAASFERVADVYASARPSYPAEAAHWLVPSDARTVVDVGAGTGKFTALLTRPGRTVIAVDPSQNMLSQLRLAVPQADAVAGSAEHLPLPDGSADAVTVAQAWHWVDVPAASAEVARVLRPGGTLGLIWNYRDERVDWVRELGVAMHADGDQFTDEDLGSPRIEAPFAEPERRQFEWVATYTREGMLDLVRSRSYFAVMNPDEQAQTLQTVSTLLDTHPQTRGRDSVELPYVTVGFRYLRP
jgi:SAM-dependent methyltransferase